MMPDLKPADPALHRILVIDDEQIVLVALRETLRREGYEVVTAQSALQGMEFIKQHPFSVILSDHQMPQMTGLEFLARVKEIQPDATRILITAVLSLSMFIDAINKCEIYRFIVKPWLREELLAIEEERLAGRAGATPDELDSYLDSVIDEVEHGKKESI